MISLNIQKFNYMNSRFEKVRSSLRCDKVYKIFLEKYEKIHYFKNSLQIFSRFTNSTNSRYNIILIFL